MTISKEIENNWGQVNCNCQLAMGSLEAGAFSEALAYAEQAVTLCALPTARSVELGEEPVETRRPVMVTIE